MFIDGVILYLEKRSFEHFEISFLKKTFYFAYLLTKRENLSHSEAKFICWFSLCMKWVWQASMATLACHAHFIQSENRQMNFASEWLKFSLFVSR